MTRQKCQVRFCDRPAATEIEAYPSGRRRYACGRHLDGLARRLEDQTGDAIITRHYRPPPPEPDQPQLDWTDGGAA